MADGNITASFNALNQPMAMWTEAYGQTTFLWFGYDPLGRCVKRWKGDANGAPVGPLPTYYYYDGWNLVQEGSGGTSVDRTYVHGARVDEIVASQVGGLWYFHHYDGQGNCIMLTAGTQPGAIQEQYDYDAFGFPYFHTSTGAKFTSPPHTRFLFTGREWLSDLRIYDYRARQYQPELGRFLQPDPKQFDAGDYNLYRYCHNDPVNKTDPTGELIDIDPNLAPMERFAVLMTLVSTTGTERGKTNFSTIVASSHTLHVTVQRDPLQETHTDALPNGSSHDGIGTDAKMELQLNTLDRVRLDQSTEKVTPDVGAAHDEEHAAAIMTGTQAPEPLMGSPAQQSMIVILPR